MAIRAYSGFTISVQAVVAPIGKVQTALTKISVEGTKAPVGIYSTAEFATDQGAEAHGIQMAEKWIDANVHTKTSPPF